MSSTTRSVIYTSDNGFFHGEHRIANGKNRVYEEAIRVPLMMRGPGIPKGVTVDDISVNADLAADDRSTPPRREPRVAAGRPIASAASPRIPSATTAASC